MNAPSPKMEFDFIEPAMMEAVIRGETIVFSPLKVAEIPAFARAVKPLMSLAAKFAAAMTAASEEASLEAMLDALVGAVAEQGEQMIKAVALAARRPVEWVGELNVDELVVLASMAVRVNMDFFGRALPGMQSIAAQLKPAAMADR